MEQSILDTLQSGKKSALVHMQKDAQLLQELQDRTIPLLHLYAWQAPSITYGYFAPIWDLVDQEKVIQRGIDIAKRPTGGGVLFHEDDFSFSLLIPHTHPIYSKNTEENYFWINSVVKEALYQLLGKEALTLSADTAYKRTNPHMSFCYATPTKYDILIGGKKVGGAAQRNTKHGLLHQSSIFFTRADFAKGVTKKKAFMMMEKNSIGLFSSPIKAFLREKFTDLLIKGFSLPLHLALQKQNGCP